jgi:hypothetical protein
MPPALEARGSPGTRRAAARAVSVGVAMALLLTVAACRVGDLLRAPERGHVEAGIDAVTVAVADSTQLTPSVVVGGEPQEARALVWTSADTTIATVDTLGWARGVARGTTLVTARVPGSHGSVAAQTDTVWVIADRLDLTPTDAVLTALDDTLCLAATPLDARGEAIPDAQPAVSVATDPDSTLTAIEGRSCVVARRNGPPATVQAVLDTSVASATVAVRQVVAGVHIAPPSSRTLDVGATIDLDAEARDRRDHPVGDATMDWSSTDTDVLTVDDAGQVSTHGEGTAYARAGAGEAADSVEFTVVSESEPEPPGEPEPPDEPDPPAAPSALQQTRSDGTPIPLGGNAGGLTVVLKAIVSDPDPGARLRLEVDVALVTLPFTDAIGGSSDQVGSGSVASASVLVVTGAYYWRARTCDETGRCSGWVSFGPNGDYGGLLNPADVDFYAP